MAKSNGQMQLTLPGKQGSRYALETSTAFPNWKSAALTVTVTNQSGVVTFPAPGATNDAQRFYRAVWQQASGSAKNFFRVAENKLRG